MDPAGKDGVLVLAATPIGNLEDASPRLAREIAAADVVAAEDTRRLRRLIRELGIELSGRVVSYFDANESTRTAELLDALRVGQRVVVVSDAGMPSVSDPGYRLVDAAVAAGIKVTVVPGPSAVLAALTVSGLPVDRFCFEGFLPRKDGERSNRLHALAQEQRTLVFFEAPHRLAATLTTMAAVFGSNRSAAVCRELTKTYEEVRRDSVGELALWAAEGVRGEVTIVVGGALEAEPKQAADLVGEVQALVDTGSRLKDAAAKVAAEHQVGRRELYEAMLASRVVAQPPDAAE